MAHARRPDLRRFDAPFAFPFEAVPVRFPTLWTRGDPSTARDSEGRRRPRIAIVGSRSACPEALAYARRVSGEFVRAGAIVVSGGALGIDREAHLGAMDEGGITWLVSPAKAGEALPTGHDDLFDTVADRGLVVSPFDPDPAQNLPPSRYRIRNTLLVHLVDALVVLQAGARSGSLHATGAAFGAGRPTFAALPSAWDWARFATRDGVGASHPFAGSFELVRHRKACVFTDGGHVLEALGATDAGEPPPAAPSRARPSTPERPRPSPVPLPEDLPEGGLEHRIFQYLSMDAQHGDTLATAAGLRAAEAATALLTLALRHVVVEGPSGFFRRNRC
ncbi:MAG: DNA-processing protein DprA [Polyangiaceae bacterium]